MDLSFSLIVVHMDTYSQVDNLRVILTDERETPVLHKNQKRKEVFYPLFSRFPIP